MPRRFRRPLAVIAAIGVSLATPTAMACTIIRSPKEERKAEQAAFRKADLVITIDAVSEYYVAMPGPHAGTLRVGLDSGQVIEAHKGARSLRGRVLNYLVVDGEDSVSCAALSSARPNHQYKLYLTFGPGAGPPMVIYRNPFFD